MADQALSSSVAGLLRPLVKILMYYGVSFAEFAEIAKRVFVETAQDDFQIKGRKQTISRVAMLTGIQRKEVSRLRQLSSLNDSELDAAYNRPPYAGDKPLRKAATRLRERPRAGS